MRSYRINAVAANRLAVECRVLGYVIFGANSSDNVTRARCNYIISNISRQGSPTFCACRIFVTRDADQISKTTRSGTTMGFVTITASPVALLRPGARFASLERSYKEIGYERFDSLENSLLKSVRNGSYARDTLRYGRSIGTRVPSCVSSNGKKNEGALPR